VTTINRPLDIAGARFRSTSSARLVKANGTNIPILSLAFAGAGANQAAFFAFPLKNYGSGNLTATLYWYADTATSGTATWGCALAAVTPSVDTGDIETKALGTENTNTSACSGSSQALVAVEVVISNLDSLATGDEVFLRVRRTDSSVSGDCLLVGINISYSDDAIPGAGIGVVKALAAGYDLP
jgi:hypothetical protein